MIRSNDLRIGNLLLHKNGQITTVTFGIIGQFDCSKKYANTIWSPIPLTEEWLVKIGFESKYDKNSIPIVMYKPINENQYLCVTFDMREPGDIDITIVTNGKSSYINFNITIYVHQLQNLYFALTGQELTIKL